MLYLERRRAERAQKRFVLMLVDVKDAIADGQKNRTLSKITNALLSVTRETDIVGWYLEDHLIGVIGTEVGKAKPKTVQSRMLEKVRAAFVEALPHEKVSQIALSFHFFPEEWEEGGTDHSANITLYPDLSRKEESRKFALGIKRSMDIVGSAAALAAAVADLWRGSSGHQIDFKRAGAIQARATWPVWKKIYGTEVPLDADGLRRHDSRGIREPVHRRPS